MQKELGNPSQAQLGHKLNWFKRVKRAIDIGFAREIDVELQKIAPDLVCNGYGTNIIDEKQRRVMVYIAHQRIINRMTCVLFLMEAMLIIALMTLVLRK